MAARTVIFTVCSNNYLSQAEVLFATARVHHPEAALVLGLADLRDPALRYPEGVEVLEAAGLGIPDFQSFAFSYDVIEFNTAVKPFLMLRLFERGHRNVLYFDPDIALYRRLDDLVALLEGGASFVLTPHFCDPPGPDASRTEQHVMQTGVYNLGFLAASQRPETEPLLRWWAGRLLHECLNEQEHGFFVDQKYMDLLPGLAAEVQVSRDTAFNVAYWNLDRRSVAAGPDGGWLIDGRPLGFFHFSGFAPERPQEVSKYTPKPAATGALKALLADYAARRLSTATAVGTPRPYAYRSFASGVAIPAMARHMFREKHLTWSGDPFTVYDRYCRLPHPACRIGAGGEIVTNLMHHHHSRNAALRFAFDLTNPFEVTAYTRFFARTAETNRVDPSLWRAAA
jgi:hypothetical protein